MLSFRESGSVPRVGVLRAVERATYEDGVHEQLAAVRAKRGQGDFDKLFASGESWVID